MTTRLLHEEWRPVVGHPGYEVSSLGRVRSLDCVIMRAASRRAKACRIFHKGRVLRPAPSNYGHLSVVLGRGKTRLIHQMVLEAFVGPRPPGKEACHGPEGHLDNSVANLRWDTRTNNILDAVREGSWFSPGRAAHLEKMRTLGLRNRNWHK